MPGTNHNSTLYDFDKKEQENEEQTPVTPPSAIETPTEPEQTISTPTEEKKGDSDGATGGYDDIINRLDAELARNKHKYDQDRKIDAVVAAINGIGDVSRAVGNIYATTQYAPNSFDPSTTTSAKYGELAAKAKSEYEKNRMAMLNYKFNAEKEKENFNFAKVKAKAAEEQAKANQAYRDKQLDLYYQREERMQQEADRKERMADWQKEYQQGQLDLKKAQIELRKWIEQGKMSRAQINHNLASWKRTKRYILDDKGKKIGEEEERIVMNPDGTLTTESSIKYDDGQGGGSSQQGGRKANPMGGSQSGTGGKKKNPMG